MAWNAFESLSNWAIGLTISWSIPVETLSVAVRVKLVLLNKNKSNLSSSRLITLTARAPVLAVKKVESIVGVVKCTK